MIIGPGQYRNAVASVAVVGSDIQHPKIDPTLPRYGTDPVQVTAQRITE